MGNVKRNQEDMVQFPGDSDNKEPQQPSGPWGAVEKVVL